MRPLAEWTLEAIREDTSDFSWMEERRYTWVPLIGSVLARMLRGEVALVLTDPPRMWFERYILNAVNDPSRNRPFLPFQGVRNLLPDLGEINTDFRITLMEDMLEIMYPQGYFFWYIGAGGHACTKIAYRKESNFLWPINEEVAGSFVLRESDPLMDMKLLQLYRLFDKSVDAALHGKVQVG